MRRVGKGGLIGGSVSLKVGFKISKPCKAQALAFLLPVGQNVAVSCISGTMSACAAMLGLLSSMVIID